MHNSPLPQTLLDTVRRQYDIFMRVQHLRYFGTSTSSPLAGDGRAHGSGPVSPDQQGSTRDVAEEERSLADWSEEYRRCAQTLVDDPAVNAVWGLASSIIRIHETGGTASVNASLALIEWYEAFLIDADYVHNKLQELLDVEFQSCTDDDVYVAGAFFLSAIERTFFAGSFNVSARIMDALLCALRSDLEEPIPADVESCLADVRRLLCVSFAGAEEHQSWQMDANDQVFEAKRILGDYVDAAAGCSSASRKIAASICAFSRDALLIMSGDAALIRSRCMESGLSLVEYVAAVCAITDPFANLAELSSIFDSCSKSWAEETHASSSPKWQYIMMGALFRTVCVEDVVEAMGKAGEQAATFAWEPMLEEEEEEGDEAGQQLSESCQRRYLLASMAAHVSDLCVQIRPRSELRSVKALFTRNTLVANYAQLVAHRPWTWRVGMSYCAYSPLMNPVELYNLALDAARWAAKDNSSYASWMACMQQLWDADSLLQTTLHRRLVEMTGDSPTTHKWFRALYHYRQKAYTDAHHFIIATRFNAGDVAYAVWLAVEVHLPQAVEKEIRRVLTSPNALRSNCIYAIGEAVHSSYISLDASPSISLSHSLSLCSAIAAYRRADRSVEVAAASSQSEMADATIRCIDSVRAVLLRAEEWSLSLSHETVLALVERAVDHLRQLREMLIRGATRGGRQSQDDGMRESAGLVVGYSLPALSKCLETSTIQQRRVISVSSTLARRTALLRERLAMLVDCHV